VYFLLSYTEIKLEKLEDARTHLQKVIELNPDFHEAHYNLALVYLNENQLDLAKEHATKALDLRPNQKEYKELVGKINGQL